MVEAVWGRLVPIRRRHQRDPGQWIRWLLRVIAMLRWAAALAACFLVGWGITTEVRTSYLQSRLLSHWAADMKFTVQPGPSEDIRSPKSGPYNERLGYAQLPSFIEALSARHFAVAQQARWSPPLERFVDQGGYPIYGEKSRAGVKLFDRDRNPLYQASYPERAYNDFSSIPPLVVDSLLFIEDHDLLDLQDPERNPAVEWGRFMLAVAGRVGSVVDRRFREGGASTLATQIDIHRAGAHPASSRNSAKWSPPRRAPIATARRRLQPGATS